MNKLEFKLENRKRTTNYHSPYWVFYFFFLFSFFSSGEARPLPAKQGHDWMSQSGECVVGTVGVEPNPGVA